MHIIEAFTAGKKEQPELNEDVWVVTADYAAVIDGATSLSNTQINGLSPGKFAAQAVAQAISTLPQQATATQAFAHISAALQQAKAPYPQANPFCVAAIYSRMMQQVWVVGDVGVLVDNTLHNHNIAAVEALCQFRAVLLHGVIASGKPQAQLLADDPSYAAYALVDNVNSALLNNPNSPYGYGVINGADIPEQFIHIIAATGAKELVLASDGYPTLLPTLAATEQTLKQRLAADPLMISTPPQPRAKKAEWTSFDDRTYLRLALR